MLRKSAFTLVELLVVIGVIALLIAILLPALSKARESASRLACASNMRQLGMAVAMYVNDNKGTLPQAYYDPDGVGPERATLWDALLYTYLMPGSATPPVNLKVMQCPNDTEVAKVSWWSYGERKSYAMVKAQGPEPGVGYAMRGTGQCFGLDPGSWAPGNVPPSWIRVGSVQDSAGTLLLVECIASNNVQAPLGQGGNGNVTAIDSPWNHESSKTYLLHRGYYNYLFLDGHVSLMTPKETVRGTYTMPSSQYQYNPGAMWSRTAGD